jgi:phosphoribosylamine--glycine ligase
VHVLVIGGGGREHALAQALSEDPAVDGLYCAPGNPGTAEIAVNRPVDASDPAAVAALATELGADLVVVGPEAPLVAGVADAVRAAGIACFGPSSAAAELEGSKAFAKDVMAAAKVPTARAHACRTLDEVAAALDDFGAPYVVKNDGLAAGKGVVVTGDREAALAHAAACGLRKGAAGADPSAAGSAAAVVVEEYLAGPEVSLFVVTDGETALPLRPAQDFKRIGDGDTGPNTGGMGAYCPLPWAPSGLVDEVLRDVVHPVLAELRARDARFTGLLYCGLALTADGPKVIEFNCRFGDPETQVVLPLLATPLAGLLHAAATGALAGEPPLRWRDGAAVTVVLAAAGYPGTPRTGDVILGTDRPGVVHAGTARRDDGELVATGGRVLSATGTGRDLTAAREAAYALIDGIELDGGQYRRDIAADAAEGRVRLP